MAFERLMYNTVTGAYFNYSEALLDRRNIVVVEEPFDPILRWAMRRWVGMWKGRKVVIIASGPSTTDKQLEHVRKAREADKCRVIAINCSYRQAPWADILYAKDGEWWDGYKDQWPDFAGPKWTSTGEAARKYDLNYIRCAHGLHGLASDISVHNENSGHQAINLAYHLGASRVLLLGYEMDPDNEKLHFFGSHDEKKGLSNPNAAIFKGWHSKMQVIADDMREVGVPVINCSPKTALTCFERGNITKELP